MCLARGHVGAHQDQDQHLRSSWQQRQCGVEGVQVSTHLPNSSPSMLNKGQIGPLGNCAVNSSGNAELVLAVLTTAVISSWQTTRSCKSAPEAGRVCSVKTHTCWAGAVCLADRVAASNQRDGFAVIHVHASKGAADVGD